MQRKIEIHTDENENKEVFEKTELEKFEKTKIEVW